MSSRSSKKTGRHYRYPSQWSAWAWSDQHQRHYRSRLRGPDDYEYEYEEMNATTASSEPVPDLYGQQQDYTTSEGGTTDTDTLAEDFAARASIGPSAASYPDASPYPNTRSHPSTAAAYKPSTLSYGAEPSYSGPYYPYASGFGSYTNTLPYAPGGSQPNPASYENATAYPPARSDVSSTPAPGWKTHIRTIDPHTDRETFDPHYKVHGAWQFKRGRVFKVLWTEPRDAEAVDLKSGSESNESVSVRKEAGGREIFAKVRRFVIINPMEGHCICLPIRTYSGKGVTKRGVSGKHHAIIYSGKKPVAFGGEKEKGSEMRPIKVTLDNPRHKLDDASRLNYAKTYTVEYNEKVWFIGRVSSDSEWQIQTDYNRTDSSLEITAVGLPIGAAGDAFPQPQQGSNAFGSSSNYGSGSPGYTLSYNVPETASYCKPTDPKTRHPSTNREPDDSSSTPPWVANNHEDARDYQPVGGSGDASYTSSCVPSRSTNAAGYYNPPNSETAYPSPYGEPVCSLSTPPVADHHEDAQELYFIENHFEAIEKRKAQDQYRGSENTAADSTPPKKQGVLGRPRNGASYVQVKSKAGRKFRAYGEDRG